MGAQRTLEPARFGFSLDVARQRTQLRVGLGRVAVALEGFMFGLLGVLLELIAIVKSSRAALGRTRVGVFKLEPGVLRF